MGAAVELPVDAGEEEAVVVGVGQLQPSGQNEEDHDDQEEEDVGPVAKAIDASSRARFLILLVMFLVVVAGAGGAAAAPRRQTQKMLVFWEMPNARRRLCLYEASGGGICVILRVLAYVCGNNGKVNA